MEHKSAKWKKYHADFVSLSQTFLTVFDLSSLGQGKKENINLIYFKKNTLAIAGTLTLIS